MRPAYNNPFNQAPNPFERRQHAIKAALLDMCVRNDGGQGFHRLFRNKKKCAFTLAFRKNRFILESE